MKGYYLSLVESALSSIDPDPRRLVQALARAADEFRNGRNPLDDGGLVAMLASDEQRGALAQVQALMSLLEGHGNAVMNRLGAELVDGQERMARVLQARRTARGATALLHRLLGLELKLRQYELGESFINAIEREAGIHAVDPAWRGPEYLPTLGVRVGSLKPLVPGIDCSIVTLPVALTHGILVLGAGLDGAFPIRFGWATLIPRAGGSASWPGSAPRPSATSSVPRRRRPLRPRLRPPRHPN